MKFHSFFFIPMLLLVTISTGQIEQPAQSILNEVQKAEDGIPKINALIQLGIHYTSYDYSKALFYLQEARSHSEKFRYKKGIADSDYYCGRVYYYMDDYVISKTYLEKARKMYESIHAKDGLADYYFALGELDFLYGNYVTAIQSIQHSLELEKETGDKRGISINLNSLSNIHREQGNFEYAMAYARQALEIKYEIKDSIGISTCLTTIGSIHEQQEHLDSAGIYYEEALELRTQSGDLRRMASSDHTLGRLLNKKKLPGEAMNHLDKAYTYFKEFEDKTGMIIVLLEKAIACRQLNKSGDSEAFIKQAFEMAEKTQNKSLLRDTYLQISNLLVENNKYREGHEYYLKYREIADSIHDVRKSRLLNEIELNYQSQLKDKTITNLQAKNELQRKNNIILSLGLATLLLFAIFIFYRYRLKSQYLKHNKVLLEKEKIIHEKDTVMQEKEKSGLEEQLESKNRELGAKILAMLRNNEMQANIVHRLANLTEHIGQNKSALKELNGIIRELENQSEDNLWEEFDKTFQSIHTDFYRKLIEINPDLSPTEIKLAAFLKLNLSTKEIAALTFKTESGIKSTRHRLRKKLGLSSEDKLINFFLKL